MFWPELLCFSRFGWNDQISAKIGRNDQNGLEFFYEIFPAGIPFWFWQNLVQSGPNWLEHNGIDCFASPGLWVFCSAKICIFFRSGWWVIFVKPWLCLLSLLESLDIQACSSSMLVYFIHFFED